MATRSRRRASAHRPRALSMRLAAERARAQLLRHSRARAFNRRRLRHSRVPTARAPERLVAVRTLQPGPQSPSRAWWLPACVRGVRALALPFPMRAPARGLSAHAAGPQRLPGGYGGLISARPLSIRGSTRVASAWWRVMHVGARRRPRRRMVAGGGWRLPVCGQLEYSIHIQLSRPSGWREWGAHPSLVDVNRASKDTTVTGGCIDRALSAFV